MGNDLDKIRSDSIQRPCDPTARYVTSEPLEKIVPNQCKHMYDLTFATYEQGHTG